MELNKQNLTFLKKYPLEMFITFQTIALGVVVSWAFDINKDFTSTLKEDNKTQTDVIRHSANVLSSAVDVIKESNRLIEKNNVLFEKNLYIYTNEKK